MATRSPTPTDAQLMMLSAYLDGELSPAEEAEVLDALSQNPQLLDAFEALSAARLPAHGLGLGDREGDQLLAGVMAATAPDALPDSVDGALHAAQLALDAEPSGQPGPDVPLTATTADAVAGFLAAADASRAALRGVGHLPSVLESLRSVPDHVSARVAAAERFGVLASAGLDGALTDAELAELTSSLPSGDPDEVPALQAALFAGEALRAASSGPAFARFGQRAGDAALHALEAEQRQAAPSSAKQPVRAAEPGWLARLGSFFGAARAPLALAGAAAALFFVVGRTGESPRETAASTEQVKREMLAAMEQVVLADASAARVPAELPLLADNSAEVEAIDAAGTTVVFATESSNITVIWVDTEEDT